MTLRGLLFDLDGTLGDTLPICFQAFRATFRQHLGRELDDRQVHAMFGPSEEGILQRQVPDEWHAALDTYLQEYERAHASCPSLFDGLQAILDRLKASGVRLAIVTGKGARSAAISARILGLHHYFERIEPGSIDRAVKPQRIRAILEDWQLPPHEVAHIGDSPSDITAARTEGVMALAAAWAPTADAHRLLELEPAELFRTVPHFASWTDRVCGFAP
jgi:pyrophosphatase PpaX